MPKPKGLFSIGEIAAVCGVSIDTLRFYETKRFISPAHIDSESDIAITAAKICSGSARFWV